MQQPLATPAASAPVQPPPAPTSTLDKSLKIVWLVIGLLILLPFIACGLGSCGACSACGAMMSGPSSTARPTPTPRPQAAKPAPPPRSTRPKR